MDEVNVMYIDSFLILLNEMKRTCGVCVCISSGCEYMHDSGSIYFVRCGHLIIEFLIQKVLKDYLVYKFLFIR